MPAIAIVLHQLLPTGVARNALAIGRHMQASGWRVTLITVRRGGELAQTDGGIDHRALGGAPMFRKLEMALKIGALRRELAGVAPDVVLSAGNHAHGAVLAAARGLPQDRRPQTVCRISNDLKHDAGRKNPLSLVSLRRLNARWVIAKATQLVLVSSHLARDPILSEAVAEGRVKVIVNGVDAETVRVLAQMPCPHPWAGEDVPIILAVGRIAPQKNFAMLIRAFARVRTDRPARLIIVGGGKRRAQAKLERLAKELGVADAVAFVGSTPNPFPYFRAAAVFALPSVWEGSANVLLEALACDVPVVASRLAGSATEVLGEGRYGLLVEPYDPDAMAKALVTQLDPGLRIQPGRRADAFSLSRTMAEYRALFTRIVS